MTIELKRNVSLTINACLLVLIAMIAKQKFSHGTLTPPTVASSTTIKPSSIAVTASGKTSAHLESVSNPAERRSVIDRLRAMGVPNDVLALVARIGFEVEWDSRFEARKGNMDALAAVQLKMNMSRDAEMRAALGEEGFRQWDQKNMLWEAMSTDVPVNPAEAQAIYALKKKLQQSQFAVEQGRIDKTMDDAAINDAYDQAYSEYFQQLKNVLGDERYAKSQQLDRDFLEGNLRYTLAAAKPSESQFQQLFQIEQASKQARSELDHQFDSDRSSPEYLDKVKALNEAYDLEYQNVLGTDAYIALQKSQDPNFVEMKKYEAHWGMNDNTLDAAYQTLKQYQNAVSEYQAQVHSLQAQGQNVNDATVNGTLQKMASQTQQQLQASLGDYTLSKLERNGVFKVYQAKLVQKAPL